MPDGDTYLRGRRNAKRRNRSLPCVPSLPTTISPSLSLVASRRHGNRGNVPVTADLYLDSSCREVKSSSHGRKTSEKAIVAAYVVTRSVCEKEEPTRVHRACTAITCVISIWRKTRATV
ncbi:uncharacterized protein LOC143146217 isoform X1 [Ptiloglossa arizonensis]|uniref:uncharacterized protein LOC143146217 isoform X1 n=1 Tax=Ptiloglossa arizonensis TaxID=3350558 RepID=UPI003FA181F4